MLQDIYNTYTQTAKGLGDYQSMSKTQLANGYCDSDEKQDYIKRDQYYSALMLRYWFKIYEWNKTSASSRLEIEDYTSWLAESLNVAFKYRSWRDPTNKLFNDPNGPDKVINRCIFSTRNRYYQYYNKDKRKINYTCDSIERQIEAFGDGAYCLEKTSEVDEIDYCKDIVNLYLNKNKIIEAIIIDAIAYQDSYKEIEVKKKYSYEEPENEDDEKPIGSIISEFSPKKVVKHLSSLNNIFALYFMNKYSVQKEFLFKAIEDLNNSSNNKLYKYLDKTLQDLKNNKEIVSILKS